MGRKRKKTYYEQQLDLIQPGALIQVTSIDGHDNGLRIVSKVFDDPNKPFEPCKMVELYDFGLSGDKIETYTITLNQIKSYIEYHTFTVVA